MANTVSKPEYWEQRYQEGSTRWDLAQAAPPIQNFLRSPDSPPPGRVAVLGCGRGYDALLFATYGFEVTGFDFAPSAIADAISLAQAQAIAVNYLQRDIFDLPKDFTNYFDYAVEHTCFCAIEKGKRPDYVKLVKSILKPEGKLIGLFFTHNRPGGPPFGVTPQEIRSYFQPDFEILSLELVSDSVQERQGEEHFGLFRRQEY